MFKVVVLLPYSGKLLREKTFVNFADLCSAMKVFSVNFLGCGMQHTAGIFGACALRSIQHVLAQVLDKLVADGPLSTVVPSLRERHPDTNIQAQNM